MLGCVLFLAIWEVGWWVGRLMTLGRLMRLALESARCGMRPLDASRGLRVCTCVWGGLRRGFLDTYGVTCPATLLCGMLLGLGAVVVSLAFLIQARQVPALMGCG